jgi:hypothetical protein
MAILRWRSCDGANRKLHGPWTGLRISDELRRGRASVPVVYRCSYCGLSELLDLAGLPGLIVNYKSTLVDGLGLGQRAIFAVVSASSGLCWSIDPCCPVQGMGPGTPADHQYRPGFAGALMLKDLGLSQDAAKAAGVATPLGSHAEAL